MTNALRFYWSVLMLDGATFERIGADEARGFWTVLKLLVVVGLVAGVGQLAGFVGIREQVTWAERTAQWAEDVTEWTQGMPTLLANALSGVVEIVDGLARTVAELDAPLGARASDLVRLIGGWLSAPLNLLAVWLVLGMVVWVFARLMGGQGTLDRHLRLVMLAAAPQLLLVVGSLPGSLFAGLTPLATAVSLIWSAVILVVTLSIAQAYSWRRAITTLLVAVVVVFGGQILLSAAVSFAIVHWLFG